MKDKLYVLARIKPNVGGHAGEKDIVRRSRLRYRNRLALKVANRSYALSAEQLETADVHSAQEHEWRVNVHLNDKGRNEGHAGVDVGGGECRVRVGYDFDVLDIGKPLDLE